MIETPGRFHSKATDHVVAGANEILDDDLNKKQSVINAENESFKDAQTELNEAQSDFNSEVHEALGTGGTVDERIANAVNTEKERAESAEEALDGRVDTLEDAVGTGGSVDSRISAAVATETARAQAAEADRYTKSETYTKEEVHNLITTPSQEYVSVTATDQTTAVTDVLPATGAADTTYRVGNWDGTQYNDSVFSEYAWDGSAYIKLSTKSQIGEVYDISANHADTKYADLAAALGTNGANVPQSLRKGGMSVKFVQSSDNKYVQYRLIANEFTTDTTQWAIADEGVYVENPEFVYVKTDKDDKILWAIKIDGGIYYGAGVPQQVIDYINEKIAELSLDEYEDIVAFLNDLEKDDKTLQDLLNEKVDKAEGKSLIDAEFASSQSAIENQEYIKVITDADDKVLEGIYKDGTKVIGGDLKVLGNSEVSGISYKVIENTEYLAAWVDAECKIIFGLKADGKTYVGDADFLDDIENIKTFLANITDKNIDWEALSSITAVENHEYIEAKVDSEGKLLAGRTPDGAAFENIGFRTPKVSINDATVENIEDPEGRTEIKIDFEEKILSYRDGDGRLHENVGIETSSITFSGTGLDDLWRDLIGAGYGNIIDWSAEKELRISEPYCAKINFTGIVNMPQAKGVDMQGYMEFWDMQGNYFKKEVIMNAQGNSTLYHPKKSIAIDICNNNGWDDEDTFNLQIGNWVSQDSFHLKAFYNDPFRCICPVAYKWFNEITKTRGEFSDYIWKKALIDFSSITPTSNGSSTAKDTEAQYNTGARCFPDGFPCIVYLNGEFYGIFSWQLKKHRDNYHMDKKNTKHIHLDGLINDSILFDGNIDWTSFEVRNPKDLIDMNNNKYDGDNPTELIDSTSSYYDPTNTKHVNTAKVKQYIQNMATMKSAVTAAYATYQASSKTAQDIADFKTVYESYFDPDNLIDYIIFSDVSNNYDGFNKNWQWLTYDGVKWYIAVYDCDGLFGGYFELNDTIVAPLTEHRSGLWMLNPIYDIYLSEMESRYADLRTDKIIDANHIIGLVVDWLDRVGNKKVFDKEWEKWPQFIKNDSIHRLQKWVEVSISNMDALYHFNQN